MSTTDSQVYTSPKRKRGQKASSTYSSSNSPSRLRITPDLGASPILLAQQTVSDEPIWPRSSQSNITDRFQTLAIRGGDALPTSPDAERASKRLAQMNSNEDVSQNQVAIAPQSDSQVNLPSDWQSFQPSATVSVFQFEPQTMHVSVDGLPSRKSRSPSLNGESNEYFWQDSEITGHSPTDSSDDGYGINGIGFKPTPAMAYARSQKRKQQVAEYKSRETREARQKRGERRRALSNSEAPNKPGNGRSPKKFVRVRFDAG